MERREFLKQTGLGAAAWAMGATRGSGATAAPSANQRPNVVVILADDMGFSDLGCYGSEIATPNIDGLARDGLRFRNAYNCPWCVPSRLALLTGRYPHRSGFEQPGGSLSPDVPTIAELLRDSGYQTFLSGKWHLGGSETRRPRARGFDHHFGILAGASNYFKNSVIRPTPVYLDDREIEKPDDFYLTDAISDHAACFVREGSAAADRPFFLHVAYTAPHFPLHARPQDIARHRGKYRKGWDLLREARYRRQRELGLFDGRWSLSPRNELDHDLPWAQVTEKDDWDLKMAVYAAQIEVMDQGVGRVLEAVRAAGIERNTLIFFLSDNGAAASNLYATEPGKKAMGVPAGPADSYTAYGLHWANVSNTPFRLYKTWVHEGGISTPLIARWPGTIPKTGGFSDEIASIMDLSATCLELAGASYPATFRGRTLGGMDGNSLQATLRGRARAGHRQLCWWESGNRAIRRGNWKLVSRAHQHMADSFKRWQYRPAPHPDGWELYNLAEDRTETLNRALAEPGRVKELAAAYEDWVRYVGVPEQPVAGDGEV